jgi:hypothetical protein
VRTPPRRVVTGHDEQGRSVVVLDTGPGNVFINEALAVKSYEMWATDESPVSIVRIPADPMGRPITIPPMPHGTVIRVADFEPDPSLRGETEVAAAATQAFAQLDPTASQWEPGAHPGLHRTETVDYAIVVDGSIDMVLDVGEVHLEAGDLLVQHGTKHAWVNRSGGVTRLVFILMDGRFDPGLAAEFGGTAAP